jgi:hypothetical protein
MNVHPEDMEAYVAATLELIASTPGNLEPGWQSIAALHEIMDDPQTVSAVHGTCVRLRAMGMEPTTAAVMAALATDYPTLHAKLEAWCGPTEEELQQGYRDAADALADLHDPVRRQA